MKSVLCIGGPLDGQHRDVDDETPFFVPVRAPLTSFSSEARRTPIVAKVRYDPVWLYGHLIYACGDVRDLTERLIQGYRKVD